MINNTENYGNVKAITSRRNPQQTYLKPTSENFVKILYEDSEFSFIRYNELSNQVEDLSDKGLYLPWSDTDDARARTYIESKYGIYNVKKFDDAFRIYASSKAYNPVKKLIENHKWDGESRICNFLTEWMRADSSAYTKEVSRLIFAGGIHRLYRPGCKFDEMPVLVGTRQGEGKSTIVRWLALDDDFFSEVTEFEGQKGIEAIEGAWICEVSELLAMTKTKEQEAVKSYLTRLNDRYRMPFDRRVTDHKRRCIFIGTTNKEQFLTDKTGNRRFYPVKVYQTGHELYENERKVKDYILQCWAEALALYDRGELKPYADPTLTQVIRERQSNATQDDYREGMIRDFLETKEEVCIPMLWYEALKMRSDIKPARKDSTEIGLIMQSCEGWVRQKTPKSFKDYGTQRYWKREWVEL